MMEMEMKRIGDHIVQINCESNRLVNFFSKNFNSYIGHDHQPDLIIKIQDDYGAPFSGYDVEITKQGSKITYQRADYLIEVDSNYQIAEISVYDELALKHALTNLYSSFIVHHQWGLLLHSSCAVETGKAHIFAGQSGAGKSTAATLSYPRELLSDEVTLVKITEEGIKIYNSPFRSEFAADSFAGNVELASIHILFQALQNKRIKIGKSDALLHLMDKVFFWPNSKDEIKTILKLMTILVKQVPVYELYFQKNNTFWELIS